MPTVLLVRHGRSTANTDGVLAGWTPGVGLDDTGRAQAEAMARRVRAVPLAACVSSPLQRCRETAEILLGARPDGQRPPLATDDRLGECRYGDWTGRALKELAKEKLWRVVQAHPSAVTFPGAQGESMTAMQHRALSAVREHDAAVAAEHGDDAVWAAVSHGDVIKAVLADALGAHLDSFQRIVVDPAGVSVVRYTALRPFVVRLNDTGGDLSGLAPRRGRRRRRARTSSDAAVGGGTGSAGGP